MNHYSTRFTRAGQRVVQALSGRYWLFVGVFVLCLMMAFAAGKGVVLPATVAAAQSVPASAASAGPLRVFQLLSEQNGWALMGDTLAWTDDGGAIWREITPVTLNTRRLLAVQFIDFDVGWVVLAGEQPGTLNLAKTIDGGRSWQIGPITQSGKTALGAIDAVYLSLVDANTGWLSITKPTSSNFSAGHLLRTADRGASWSAGDLPVAGSIVFVDATHGWLAGGATGDALWYTDDGGATWRRQLFPIPMAPEAARRRFYTPLFAINHISGIVPALVSTAAGQVVEWYITGDGGGTWQLERSFVLDAATIADKLPAELDPKVWLLQRTNLPVMPAASVQPFFPNSFASLAEGAGRRIIALDMATATTGWAMAEPGRALLRTRDSSASWTALALPEGANSATASAKVAPPLFTATPLSTGSRTSNVKGAGFDVCDLPSPLELGAWYSESPYRIVNLYLGGVLRFCDNDALTKASATAVGSTGLEVYSHLGWPAGAVLRIRGALQRRSGVCF